MKKLVKSKKNDLTSLEAYGCGCRCNDSGCECTCSSTQWLAASNFNHLSTDNLRWVARGNDYSNYN